MNTEYIKIKVIKKIQNSNKTINTKITWLCNKVKY